MVNVLGRGLSSLLKEESNVITTDQKVDIELLEPNLKQPRKHFNETKIKELADSIVSLGLVHPIVVTKKIGGKYIIIAGERRYRACKMAGINKVPITIKNVNDREILEIALVENIQRAELTVIEEAESYHQLVVDYGYSQTDLANSLGKSRSHIANILRLNSLSDKIKMLVNDNKLSMGHARALIGIEDADNLADKIVENDLNVRQTEELVSKKRERNTIKAEKESTKSEYSEQDDEMVLLGQQLSERFGVKVVVENSWNGGRITISYKNADELDSVLQIIQ